MGRGWWKGGGRGGKGGGGREFEQEIGWLSDASYKASFKRCDGFIGTNVSTVTKAGVSDQP